jgi:hypothetical protein
MKLFLAAALVIASLFAVPTPAKEAKPDLAKATLLVYQGKQVCKYHEEAFFIFEEQVWGCEFKSNFTCTATVVGESGHEYIGLTAGHCFDWNAVDKNEYYVADKLDEKPVLHKIKIVKFENDERYDYGVFTFESLERYDVMPIADNVDPKVGDEVLNINYSLGLTQQVTVGKIESGIIESPAMEQLKDTKGRFLASINGGPGASGSAVVDKKSGQIIGLLEGHFPNTRMGMIVMPTGQKLKNFLQDDSAGLRPQKAGPLPKPHVAPKPPAPTFWELVQELIRRILHKIGIRG